MKRFADAIFGAAALCAFAAVAHAGKPAPPPVTAPTVFASSYNFDTASKTYPASITVPSDGAWFYGTATYGTLGFMDCDHRYEVDLNPATLSPDYQPFLTLGYIANKDAPCAGFNACFSCTVDFGGVKPLADYTPSTSPGWLPEGSATATLQTLNGGGTNDTVNFTLYQVNAVSLQSMSVYEAETNDVPARASQDEVNSRAYIASSDDRVPLVPQFAFGTATFPAPPNAMFSGSWDTGDPLDIDVKRPYFQPDAGKFFPGNIILLVKIPSMKTGIHTISLTAALPGGKTFTAPSYTVYVYNVGIEASVNGGSFASGAATYPRTADVTFRINQQDAKGKTITITKADWKFHGTQTGVDVLGKDDGLATNATQWSGKMNQSGVLSVNVTIQVGKLRRTSHAPVSGSAVVNPRTGSSWTTTQTLCENCWNDLATNNGGWLDLGLVLPTTQNVQDTTSFASNHVITRGQTGDRRSYENGIRDRQNPQDFLLRPRLAPKPYPLYRPFDSTNDPTEWPDRYSVAQIPSGPNRLFWYVTQQNFKTDFGFAVSAYFDPSDVLPNVGPSGRLGSGRL